MIYLWRKDDGDLGMASDTIDREAAKAADLIDNWAPGSNLEMMLDTAQMIARKIGLFSEPGECIFPYGPICVPAPMPNETMETCEERIRKGWSKAEVIEAPDGVHCAPLARRQRRIAR